MLYIISVERFEGGAAKSMCMHVEAGPDHIFESTPMLKLICHIHVSLWLMFANAMRMFHRL